eukprot:8988508-Prorocentrum_lima.AAC.1
MNPFQIRSHARANMVVRKSFFDGSPRQLQAVPWAQLMCQLIGFLVPGKVARRTDQYAVRKDGMGGL